MNQIKFLDIDRIINNQLKEELYNITKLSENIIKIFCL